MSHRAKRYAVGARTGQIAHIHAHGQVPLVNIVEAKSGFIVGGFTDESLARDVVALLNGEAAEHGDDVYRERLEHIRQQATSPEDFFQRRTALRIELGMQP